LISSGRKMLVPEREHTGPCEFRGLALVRIGPLLVHEAVLRRVAENLCRFSRTLKRCFELVDRLRRAPVILVGKMGLERHVHVAGLGDVSRRDPVKAHRRAELRSADRAEDGDRAAQAEAGEPDLGACQLEILGRAAYQLVGRFDKVERAHFAVCGFRVVIRHDGPGIEVRCERLISRRGEPVANALDLILQPPLFLDDDDAWSVGAPGFSEIARAVFAIGSFERDLRAHASSKTQRFALVRAGKRFNMMARRLAGSPVK
jgi:hypothetical protein